MNTNGEQAGCKGRGLSGRLCLLERMTVDTASQSAAIMQIKEKWFTKPNGKQTTFGYFSIGTWFLMWLSKKNSASFSVFWANGGSSRARIGQEQCL